MPSHGSTRVRAGTCLSEGHAEVVSFGPSAQGTARNGSSSTHQCSPPPTLSSTISAARSPYVRAKCRKASSLRQGPSGPGQSFSRRAGGRGSRPNEARLDAPEHAHRPEICRGRDVPAPHSPHQLFQSHPSLLEPNERDSLEPDLLPLLALERSQVAPLGPEQPPQLPQLRLGARALFGERRLGASDGGCREGVGAADG